MSRIVTDLIFLLLIGIIIVYFTGCDKSAGGSSNLGLYCPDQHEEYTQMCMHTCLGDWVRLMGEAEIHFDTERECNQ